MEDSSNSTSNSSGASPTDAALTSFLDTGERPQPPATFPLPATTHQLPQAHSSSLSFQPILLPPPSLAAGSLTLKPPKRGPGRPRKDSAGLGPTGSSVTSRSARGSYAGRARPKNQLLAAGGFTPTGEGTSMRMSTPGAGSSSSPNTSSPGTPGIFDSGESPSGLQPPPINFVVYDPKRCCFCYLPAASQLGQGDLQDYQLQPNIVNVQPKNVQREARQRSPSVTTVDRRPRTQLELMAWHKNGEVFDEIEIIGVPDDISLPQLIDSETSSVSAHFCCAMLSEGVNRTTPAAASDQSEATLVIDNAVVLGLEQRCTGCEQYGATIKCRLEGCSRRYHYPCGVGHGGFLDLRDLVFYCPDHVAAAKENAIRQQIQCHTCEQLGRLESLLFCTNCARHYHTDCLQPALRPSLKLRAGWRCGDCKVCQHCRKDSEDGRWLTCETCDSVCHLYCSQPTLAQIPKQGWKCKFCRRCNDCGSRTPGSGHSSRWHNNYRVCDSCYQQRNKGLYCPVCSRAYRFQKQKSMRGCSQCNKQTHFECDPEAARPGDHPYLCCECRDSLTSIYPPPFTGESLLTGNIVEGDSSKSSITSGSAMAASSSQLLSAANLRAGSADSGSTVGDEDEEELVDFLRGATASAVDVGTVPATVYQSSSAASRRATEASPFSDLGDDLTTALGLHIPTATTVGQERGDEDSVSLGFGSEISDASAVGVWVPNAPPPRRSTTSTGTPARKKPPGALRRSRSGKSGSSLAGRPPGSGAGRRGRLPRSFSYQTSSNSTPSGSVYGTRSAKTAAMAAMNVDDEDELTGERVEKKKIKEEDTEYIRTVVVTSSKDEYVFCQDLCLICGSLGKGEEGQMIACSQCAQCYHTYCANVHDKLSSVLLRRGWRCLDCTVCEGCGDGADESQLLLCDECDVAFHTYCLQPPLPRIPDGPWRCHWCSKCVRCAAPMKISSWRKSAGSQSSVQPLCAVCLSLKRCQRCVSAYQLNDLILQCQLCKCWLHGKCDDLGTEELLETASENGYRCWKCRPPGTQPLSMPNALDWRQQHQQSVTVDGVQLTKSGLDLTQWRPGPGPTVLPSGAVRGRRPSTATAAESAIASTIDEVTASMMTRMTSPIAGAGGRLSSMGVVGTPEQDDIFDGQLDDGMGDGMPFFDPPTTFATDGIVPPYAGTTGGRRARGRRGLKVGVGGFTVRLPRQRTTTTGGNEAGPSDPPQTPTPRDGAAIGEIDEEGGTDATPSGGEKPKLRRKRRMRGGRSQLEDFYPSFLQTAFFGLPGVEGKQLLERSVMAPSLEEQNRPKEREPAKQRHTTAHELSHAAAESLRKLQSESASKQMSHSSSGNVDDTAGDPASQFAGVDIDQMVHQLGESVDGGIDQIFFMLDPEERQGVGSDSAAFDALMGTGHNLEMDADVDSLIGQLGGSGQQQGNNEQQLQPSGVAATIAPSTAAPSASSVEQNTGQPPMSAVETKVEKVESVQHLPPSGPPSNFYGQPPPQAVSLPQHFPMAHPTATGYPHPLMQQGQQQQMMPGRYPSQQQQQQLPLPPKTTDGSNLMLLKQQQQLQLQQQQAVVDQQTTSRDSTDNLAIGCELDLDASQGGVGADGRSTFERWREDERNGDRATIAAILFANLNHSELIEHYPEWNDRFKHIQKLWRSLEASDRQRYVQMARDNRAANKASGKRAKRTSSKGAQPRPTQLGEPQSPYPLAQQPHSGSTTPILAAAPFSPSRAPIGQSPTTVAPPFGEMQQQQQRFAMQQQMHYQQQQMMGDQFKMPPTPIQHQQAQFQMQQQQLLQQQQQHLKAVAAPPGGQQQQQGSDLLQDLMEQEMKEMTSPSATPKRPTTLPKHEPTTATSSDPNTAAPVSAQHAELRNLAREAQSRQRVVEEHLRPMRSQKNKLNGRLRQLRKQTADESVQLPPDEQIQLDGLQQRIQGLSKELDALKRHAKQMNSRLIDYETEIGLRPPPPGSEAPTDAPATPSEHSNSPRTAPTQPPPPQIRPDSLPLEHNRQFKMEPETNYPSYQQFHPASMQIQNMQMRPESQSPVAALEASSMLIGQPDGGKRKVRKKRRKISAGLMEMQLASTVTSSPYFRQHAPVHEEGFSFAVGPFAGIEVEVFETVELVIRDVCLRVDGKITESSDPQIRQMMKISAGYVALPPAGSRSNKFDARQIPQSPTPGRKRQRKTTTQSTGTSTPTVGPMMSPMASGLAMTPLPAGAHPLGGGMSHPIKKVTTPMPLGATPGGGGLMQAMTEPVAPQGTPLMGSMSVSVGASNPTNEAAERLVQQLKALPPLGVLEPTPRPDLAAVPAVGFSQLPEKPDDHFYTGEYGSARVKFMSDFYLDQFFGVGGYSGDAVVTSPMSIALMLTTAKQRPGLKTVRQLKNKFDSTMKLLWETDLGSDTPLLVPYAQMHTAIEPAGRRSPPIPLQRSVAQRTPTAEPTNWKELLRERRSAGSSVARRRRQLRVAVTVSRRAAQNIAAVMHGLQALLELPTPIEYHIDTPPHTPEKVEAGPLQSRAEAEEKSVMCRQCDTRKMDRETMVKKTAAELGLLGEGHTLGKLQSEGVMLFCTYHCFYRYALENKTPLSANDVKLADTNTDLPTLTALKSEYGHLFEDEYDITEVIREAELLHSTSQPCGESPSHRDSVTETVDKIAQVDAKERVTTEDLRLDEIIRSVVGNVQPYTTGTRETIVHVKDLPLEGTSGNRRNVNTSGELLSAAGATEQSSSSSSAVVKVEHRWKGYRWQPWDDTLRLSFITLAHEMQQLLAEMNASFRPLILPEDVRVCELCGLVGDQPMDGCGRLLNMDANRWLHVSCALWSSEVYETVGGALMNVDAACRRARTQRCAACQRDGATAQCYKLRCTANYHFPCAQQARCLFMNDKTLFCHEHGQQIVSGTVLERTAVIRRVYVERDENQLIAKLFQQGDSGDLTLRVGSLIYHHVGQLLAHQLRPPYYNSDYIYPVNYSVTRIYWSASRLNRRVRYRCQIEDVENHQPQFVLRFTDGDADDSTTRELVLKEQTASSAWNSVLTPLERMRDKEQLLKLFPRHLIGETLYGLAENSILRMIESLPGVEGLGPVYQFKHGGSPLMDLPLAVNPSGCARCEPRFRDYIKSHRNHGSGGHSTALHPSPMKKDLDYKRQLAASGISNDMLLYGAAYSRFEPGTVQGNKWSQYNRMKAELRNTVHLGRSKIQGLGLYAKRDIDMNTMIIEYIGEVIRNEVAERREKLYQSQNRGVYMFRIDSERVVDATMAGGPARYINHSCDPNCSTQLLPLGTNPNDLKIIIIANRPIKNNEELTYDYQFDLEDQTDKLPCLCGAPNCHKWMN